MMVKALVDKFFLLKNVGRVGQNSVYAAIGQHVDVDSLSLTRLAKGVHYDALTAAELEAIEKASVKEEKPPAKTDGGALVK